MASIVPCIIYFFTALFLLLPNVSISRRHQRIAIPHSPGFIPRSLAWDESKRGFILAGAASDPESLPSVHTISDAGDLEALLPALLEFPPNSFVVSIATNSQSGRLFTAISTNDGRSSVALGAYDLGSGTLVFQTPLPNAVGSVATDSSGNAFATDATADVVYKINSEGSLSVLSSSSILRMPESQSSSNGLSGVVFVNRGFLLACQKDSGKMFRIDAKDGVTRQVQISGGDIVGSTIVRLRRDGNLVAVGERGAYLVKGRDKWVEANVIDGLKFRDNVTAIDAAVREGERVYVLFKSFNGFEKDEFFLEEMEFPKEAEGGQPIGAFLLLGLAIVYVVYWRFQMSSLASSMNKKTN